MKNNDLINSSKIKAIAQWIDKYEKEKGFYYEMYLKKYAPNDPASKKYKRLTEINSKRNQPARLLENHNHHFIPLKDAEYGLDYHFNHILSKWDSKLSVIKGPPGIGKTFQLENCKHTDEWIIAVPNHKLKKEISDRLKVKGVEHNIIPKRPELPPPILKEYQSYQGIGRHDLAAGFLRSLIHGDLNRFGIILTEASMLRYKLINYFTAIDRAVNDTLPILCTHKRILHTEFPNHSTLIIDEDILETMIDIKSVSLASIRKALKKIQNVTVKDILQKLVDLSNDPQHIDREMPISEITNNVNPAGVLISRQEIQSLIKVGVKDEIISLFNAEYFIIKSIDWDDPDADKVIHFILKHELPDMRTIILSATANEFIYQKIFDDVDFYYLSNVEMKGVATQYSNRSFSRRSFDSEGTIDWVEKISIEYPDHHFITYFDQKYQDYFDLTFMHIENIEGTDELYGKDIGVLATPNKPPFVYKLLASLLGIEYSQDDEYKEREVEHNGFEFTITTFENEELRKIQFHFIESRLVQAVGRARLIREPSSVVVFSKYPLIGFTQNHLKDMPTHSMTADVFNLQPQQQDDDLPLSLPSGSMAS